MALPNWAEKALLNWPKSARLEWQRGLVHAFTANWAKVHSDRWRVPDDHPSYATGHWDPELSSADLVRKRIVQTVLDVGWDRHYGRHPSDAREAKVKLEGINEQICVAAEQLAKLFRDREAILEKQEVEDQSPFGYPDGDRFDLFEALAQTAQDAQFSEWHDVAGDALNRFLALAWAQSRPRPHWPDLLDQLGYESGRMVLITNPGALAQSSTKSTEVSAWALQLIGELDAGWHATYPKGFLIDCLTPGAIAGFLQLVLGLTDYESHNLNRTVSKLIDRYRRRATQRP
jgi:hypothetical protein